MSSDQQDASDASRPAAVDEPVAPVKRRSKLFPMILMGAGLGIALGLFHPEFEVAVPDGQRVSMPLFYAIGNRDEEMRDLLEHWMDLRKKDGTERHLYDYWGLGQQEKGIHPRWCIMRDVLGWDQ